MPQWLALQPGLAEAGAHNMIMLLERPRLGHYQVSLRLADTRGSARLGQLGCMHMGWRAWFPLAHMMVLHGND
jgi:hypothetical protein